MVTIEVCLLFVLISCLFGAFVGDSVATKKAKRKGKRRHRHHQRRHRKKAKAARSVPYIKLKSQIQRYIEKALCLTPTELAELRTGQGTNGRVVNRNRLRAQSEGYGSANAKAPARPKNARAKTS